MVQVAVLKSLASVPAVEVTDELPDANVMPPLPVAVGATWNVAPFPSATVSGLFVVVNDFAWLSVNVMSPADFPLPVVIVLDVALAAIVPETVRFATASCAGLIGVVPDVVMLTLMSPAAVLEAILSFMPPKVTVPVFVLDILIIQDAVLKSPDRVPLDRARLVPVTVVVGIWVKVTPVFASESEIVLVAWN